MNMTKGLYLLLILCLGSLPLQGQTQQLCVSDPTARYYVTGFAGSTFVWNTYGNGTITDQGNDTVFVTWNNTPGTYQLSVQEINTEGCEGPVQWLSVELVEFRSTQNISICNGDSFTLPDGNVVNTAGTYVVTLASATGCDSVITTNLTINNIDNIYLDVSICNGQSYTLPDGHVVSLAGTYTVTLTASTGCDSTIITNLVVNDISNTTVEVQICQGDVHTLPDGNIVSVPGTYPVTILGSTGCDSIITTHLKVTDIPTSTLNVQICEGSIHTLPDGNTVSVTGTYPATLTASTGCDSIVITNLTVISTPVTTLEAEICDGAAYTLPDGNSVAAAGTYPVTLMTSTGCDSTVIINLKVVNTLTTFIDVQICSGQSHALPDGNVVSVSGIYPVTLISSTGCDSIVTTNLKVNEIVNIQVSAQVCSGQSYTLPDGQVVSTAGSYPVTLAASTGCDSIVITHLAVVNVLTSSADIQICSGQSYTLPDGHIVSTSGSYPVTLTASSGCDSIVTTQLTVLNALSAVVNAAICSGQSHTLPDGSVVSTSGAYPVTLTAPTGCDSIVTTHLTVVNTLTASIAVQICTGQSHTLPDGSVVSTAGSYPVKLTSSAGCDSIVTTHLTVVSTLTTAVAAQICEGQSHTLANGNIVSEAGTYPVTLTASSGCDSIVTTTLTVFPTLSAVQDIQVCSGHTFTLPDGHVVSASGVYPVTLTASTGCDSVVTTHLVVLPILTDTLNIQICEGQSHTLPDGSVVSTAGNYPVNFATSNGCDSVVLTIVTLSALPQVYLGPDTTLCETGTLEITLPDIPGTEYEWQDGSSGNTYVLKDPGTYFVTAVNLCGTATDTLELSTTVCEYCGVYMPNAFSPNGDGLHDMFRPIVTCSDIRPFLFRIYNRWNELVFESNDPLSGWNGIYKGQQQPTDTYIYHVVYFNTTLNKEITISGVVTILN